ncbi:hypothetical protein TWF506_003126 [Arthrobotrys conoides]|uniref:Uncharacterized protein n=1 Tax=Arthrobotrys conoides TaxID=74498 RepID=A0AAN8NC90_9PEZI
MVNFQISAASAVAILASFSQVDAHVRFLQSWGNHNHRIGGGALGHLYTYAAKNHGPDQWPGQWDVIAFSDPVVPAWAPSPHYGRPRRWMSQGCGASLQTTYDYAYSQNPGLAAPPSLANNWGELWKHRNYFVFMAPVHGGAYVQTKSAVVKEIQAGRMAQSTPGGWLEIATYQVNDDGAGPFRCRIDETGDGQNFGDWVYPVRQPPGAHGHASIGPWWNNQQSIIRVNLPANIKCKGEYSPNHKTVCMVRCENYAPNGPFGACVPVHVIYPPEAPKPQPIPVKVEHKPEPEPPKGDPGYNVGNNNYKENSYYKHKLKRRFESMAGTRAIEKEAKMRKRAEEKMKKRAAQPAEAGAGTDALAAESKKLGHTQEKRSAQPEEIGKGTASLEAQEKKLGHEAD